MAIPKNSSFPKKNKDISADVAFPILGSKDPAYSRYEVVDNTYDYTNQSLPGRMGGDPRLTRDINQRKVHLPNPGNRQA